MNVRPRDKRDMARMALDFRFSVAVCIGGWGSAAKRSRQRLPEFAMTIRRGLSGGKLAGYPSPADLADLYPQFYWSRILSQIQTAIRR